MNNFSLWWWTLVNAVIGTTALVWNPGFKNPFYMIACIALVVLWVLGPFLLFLFGWRIGEQVPFERSRLFLLLTVFIAVPLLFSPEMPMAEGRFGGYLLYIYLLPVMFIVLLFNNIGWIVLLGIPLILGYLYFVAWLMVAHDYYLVRKTEKPVMPDDNGPDSC